MGYPKPIGLNLFDRDNRFSWAYLLRRPRQSGASMVELTVVVFEGRPLVPNQSLTPDEAVFGADPNTSVSFDTTSNTVTLGWNANNVTAPSVRVGSWIFDSTPSGALPPYTQPHARFYRVTGVTDGVDGKGNPTLALELQQPLRNFAANTPGQAGVVIVMDSVITVVEKGTGG
jgi:hypothetical protein